MRSHPWIPAALLAAALLGACDVTRDAAPSSAAAGPRALTGCTTTDTNAVAGALPFCLEFPSVAWQGPTLPKLQSYTLVSVDGTWLVIGGRRNQGLHMFGETGANMPVDSSNTWLWAIDPKQQTVDSFPVHSLPDSLWPLLASTNAHGSYDPATGRLVYIGGYGWKADSSDMTTFGHITLADARAVVRGIRTGISPDSMAGLFHVLRDPRFAITGGGLTQLNGVYFLAFGQLFNGQYRPFSGTFVQRYTNAIAQFTLASGLIPRVLSYTTLTSSDASQPFHRRDGNFVDDVDPATGAPRLAGFGGVFPPGIIGGYANAVYVDLRGARVDNALSQRFNAYEAPAVAVWDSTGQTTYRTFYGGIGATWYHQTQEQDSVFRVVTAQGRNDGLPFVADVSTLVTSPSGYTEWILPAPTTSDTLLVGASADFIPDDSLVRAGTLTDAGIVRLQALRPGQSVRLGWVYGGIQAANPLPTFPGTGTAATNLLREVWITYAPAPAIPAAKGNSARPPYPPFTQVPPRTPAAAPPRPPAAR